ncbi:voltage-gated ion channel superfamily, putative [Bodo saltans]|uniref:Voltage-gated ion channel superfamily, putative n=1 Tax=Bodo saltans TaxID=75058 RepID=A0A0S4INJ5_BODSA|nr:voltage-gated ion channel superfamily, putative [Bodo saltans]|eukprot:CUF66702.1 voltage-gated ion channel superfamily, putative [Bodo saltans]
MSQDSSTGSIGSRRPLVPHNNGEAQVPPAFTGPDNPLRAPQRNQNLHPVASDKQPLMATPGSQHLAASSHHSRAGSSRPTSATVSFVNPLTEAEIIDQQRHADAVKSANAAIQEVEDDEEINLTLWEQASWNSKIYAIVESGSFPSDIPPSVERAAIIVALLTAFVILLSCASILALSFPQYVDSSPAFWSQLEVFCVVIFTLDLVIRLMTCPKKDKFFYDFFNWVDIISILPFYVSLFGSDGFPWYLRIIRALRIARLVKVLKSRGILGLKDLLNTVTSSFAGTILYFIVALTGLLVFATCIYFSERGTFDNPTELWWRHCTIDDPWCVYANVTTLLLAANGSMDNVSLYNSNHTGSQVSPFQSIAQSLWFTMSTMTTAGIGEVTPNASVGRFVTVIMGFAGVFFIGLPTMILAGNHVAHKVMNTENIVRNSWADLHRRKRRLVGGVLGSLDIVRRYFGWNAASDKAWSVLQLEEEDEENGLTLAVPSAAAMNNANVDAAKAAAQSRASLVVGFYRDRGMLREIRMSMVDPQEFLFEPLYVIAKDETGRPKANVIWASDGMPTLVEFQVLLENEDTQEAVMRVAKQLNPNARIRCDSQSGLTIKHSSPLDALRTQEVNEAGEETIHTITRWTMLPVKARPGFRESSFPVYFHRTGGDWDDPQQHQNDEVRFTPQEIIEDALASLLGSGLLIETFIPIPPVRRRVMVVTQFLQRTRLHRELELVSHRASREVPFEQLTAYITDSDFCRLLEGVGRRVELIDPSLIAEDLPAVERAVADVILRGLRRTRVVQIPTRFDRCVYNTEVLEENDLVYEVPMSLFVGDEDDEVEQDSIGYVEVTARAAYGRAVRIDFSVSMDPPAPITGDKIESFVTAAL